MPNGAFTKGSWNQLPSNCTRDYTLTLTRCVEYGTAFITECLAWIQNVVQTCLQWAWSTATTCIAWGGTCCSWWPCSWVCAVIVDIVCVLFAIIVSLVCLVFALIVSLVCAIVLMLEVIFCMLWGVIEIIFCMSSANGGTAFLLTDGTVMVQECKSIFGASWGTHRWWRLTPDQSGSYVNGRWSQLASSIVARKYFASAVLADGRVLVCGGEYTDASGTTKQDWSNSCEIYDPVANTWSLVPSPKDASGATWANVGDTPCTVLPNGKFLMGSDFNQNVAELDPATLAWTAMNTRKIVSNSDEDSWVLMPNNTIAAPSCRNSPTTWVYNISTDNWNQGIKLPVAIVDVGTEIGPALLRYDGTAFFLGANQHTAIHSPAANPQWFNGIDLPQQSGKDIGIVDGPAALLVNGNILFGAAPIDGKGSYLSPSMYFEFDGTSYNRTNDPPNSNCPTYVTRLLLLPNGDIMFCREDDSSFYAYHSDAATPQDSFRPVIQNFPANVIPGSTVQISGLQFNGLSQAVAYGDDSQTATNYPLVRIVNKQSNHVRYCRTFNHTTVDANGNTVPSMGVATGAAVITTNVVIPADIELGPSSLVVVANGIPSKPVDATVSSAQAQRPRGGR
jgi:hypothetical protein